MHLFLIMSVGFLFKVNAVYYLPVIKKIFFYKTEYKFNIELNNLSGMNFFNLKRLLIISLSILVITFIPITHLVFIKFYDGDIIANFHIYTCSELYDCYYYIIFNLNFNKVILVISYSFTIFYSVHNLLKIEKISLKKKLELLKIVCKIFIHNIGKSILILIII